MIKHSDQKPPREGKENLACTFRLQSALRDVRAGTQNGAGSRNHRKHYLCFISGSHSHSQGPHASGTEPTVNTIPHRRVQPNLIQEFNNWEASRMAAGRVKLKVFKAKRAPVLNVEHQSMGWSPGLCTSIHHLPTGYNGTPAATPSRQDNTSFLKSLRSSGQETHIAT